MSGVDAIQKSLSPARKVRMALLGNFNLYWATFRLQGDAGRPREFSFTRMPAVNFPVDTNPSVCSKGPNEEAPS
jgi:hypothetical protein